MSRRDVTLGLQPPGIKTFGGIPSPEVTESVREVSTRQEPKLLADYVA